VSILTTHRCLLRPIGPDDADDLHRLSTSPGVSRYLWDSEIIPLARTRDVIAQSERLFAARDHGLWGAWTADSRRLCGFAGLWPFRDPPEMELLYGVAEDLWGQGYATEIAQAIVRHCLDQLQMPVLRASTDAGNAASVRVLEKLGFVFDRRATVDGLETVFYALERHRA
jgi:[ribosomal protein S5]-alanine N-acetyltransferase